MAGESQQTARRSSHLSWRVDLLAESCLRDLRQPWRCPTHSSTFIAKRTKDAGGMFRVVRLCTRSALGACTARVSTVASGLFRLPWPQALPRRCSASCRAGPRTRRDESAAVACTRREADLLCRSAWTAAPATRSGPRSRTASSCASSAAASTAAWECTSASCGALWRAPAPGAAEHPPGRSVTMDSWSPQQLKMMQAGGNDGLNSFVAVRVWDPRLAPRSRVPGRSNTAWLRRPTRAPNTTERRRLRTGRRSRQPRRAAPGQPRRCERRAARPGRCAEARPGGARLGGCLPCAPVLRPRLSLEAVPLRRLLRGRLGLGGGAGAGRAAAARHAVGGGPAGRGRLHAGPAEGVCGGQGRVLLAQDAAERGKVGCAGRLWPAGAEACRRPAGLPPSQGGKYVGFGSAPPPGMPSGGGGSSQVRPAGRAWMPGSRAA